jgi:hypothetical protein
MSPKEYFSLLASGYWSDSPQNRLFRRQSMTMLLFFINVLGANRNIAPVLLLRRVKKECIDTIIGKSYVGDWFLFYLLGQNIDSVIFKVRGVRP